MSLQRVLHMIWEIRPSDIVAREPYKPTSSKVLVGDFRQWCRQTSGRTSLILRVMPMLSAFLPIGLGVVEMAVL